MLKQTLMLQHDLADLKILNSPSKHTGLIVPVRLTQLHVEQQTETCAVKSEHHLTTGP